MLERDVDSRIVTFARHIGCIVIKLTTLGARGESGWPDRLFLKLHKFVCPNCGVATPVGKVVFIEMKRTGEESSPKQVHQQNRLAEQGFTVYKDIDDPETGKQIIRTEFLGDL
jgi:hypothetical protein